MKALLLAILITSISFSSLAQHSPKMSYLVVRLDVKTDHFHKKGFVCINAEQGNPAAADLYSLMPYDTERGPGTAFSFYSETPDTAVAYYNYFTNTTEALLFLSAKGWHLLSVNNEISTSGEFMRAANGLDLVPIASVSSRPIYYFKKEL